MKFQCAKRHVKYFSYHLWNVVFTCDVTFNIDIVTCSTGTVFHMRSIHVCRTLPDFVLLRKFTRQSSPALNMTDLHRFLSLPSVDPQIRWFRSDGLDIKHLQIFTGHGRSSRWWCQTVRFSRRPFSEVLNPSSRSFFYAVMFFYELVQNVMRKL